MSYRYSTFGHLGVILGLIILTLVVATILATVYPLQTLAVAIILLGLATVMLL